MQSLGLVWNNFDPSNADLIETQKAIAEPTQFGAKLLLEHWHRRHAEGGFVVGRDVPSRPLACVLRNLAVFEPTEGMRDFRVRLAGAAFLRRFGRDITGLSLSDLYSQARFRAQRTLLADTIAANRPDAEELKVEHDARVFLHGEGLRLPVFAPKRAATWLICGLFYFDWA